MQRADPEDQRHVDRHVGAHVPAPVAGAQVPDGQQAAEDEPAQRHDRQRHVDVEDLLDEALVGVQRRVEEHQRERHADRGDGGEREAAEAAAVQIRWQRLVLQEEVEHRVGEQGEHQIIKRQDRQPLAGRRSATPWATSSGPTPRAVAISAGISSGSPMIGPIRSRARVWTAIAETSVPITASAMSAEHAAPAISPGSARAQRRPEQQQRERRHRDHLEHDQEDEQRRGLGDQQRRCGRPAPAGTRRTRPARARPRTAG